EWRCIAIESDDVSAEMRAPRWESVVPRHSGPKLTQFLICAPRGPMSKTASARLSSESSARGGRGTVNAVARDGTVGTDAGHGVVAGRAARRSPGVRAPFQWRRVRADACGLQWRSL